MPDELDPESFELNTPADSGEQETDDTPSLGNSFLAKIPEQDRDIVAKYVKDWDSGVTKKFQEIHGQYKPYKDLGVDVEDIQRMVAFREQLNSDPYTIYKNMTNLLREQDGEQLQRILEEMFNDEEEYEDGDEEYEESDDSQYPDGIPPQVAEYLESLGAKVGQFEEFINSQTQAREEAEQFAQFDKLLQDAHTKHGDFDDELVTYRISQGYGIDDSVSWYKNLVGGNSQGRRPAPSLMGSQGGVPIDQVDVTKLSGPDRRNLVEEILKSRQQ